MKNHELLAAEDGNMIGRITTLLVAPLLLGCTQQQPFSVASAPRDSNAIAAANYKEAHFFRNNPNLGKRAGNTLTLYLPNGSAKTFEDEPLEKCERETPVEIRDGVRHHEVGPCVVYHRVVSFLPEKYWFLVEVLFYEGAETLVVTNTGKQVRIGGLPILSPSRQGMLTYTSGCFDDDAGIIVWGIKGVEPDVLYFGSLFERSDGGGQIFGVSWETDERIRLNVASCDDDKPTDHAFLTRHSNGKWIWSGTNPQYRGNR